MLSLLRLWPLFEHKIKVFRLSSKVVAVARMLISQNTCLCQYVRHIKHRKLERYCSGYKQILLHVWTVEHEVVRIYLDNPDKP